jgi:hypothetical protein
MMDYAIPRTFRGDRRRCVTIARVLHRIACSFHSGLDFARVNLAVMPSELSIVVMLKHRQPIIFCSQASV